VDLFDQYPQYFGNAPGLGHTPPGSLRRVAVEDLRDVAKPTVGEMILQGRKPLGCLAAS